MMKDVMRTMPLVLVLLAVSAAAPPCVLAQAPAAAVDRIEDAYRQLEYESAEQMAQTALENYSDYTVEQLTVVHTILALIAYNRSELPEARRQFVSALQLNPDLELDPVLVPPKIQTYFQDVKAEAAAATPDPSDAPVRYVLMRDPRADAALRSMLVPGWGQLYKGHDTKAYVFAGLFAVSAGGTVFAHFRRSNARNLYDRASTVNEAADRYDTYNVWHRTRNGLFQAAVAVWAASYVDALLTRASLEPAESVSIQASSSTFSLTVHL